MNLCRQLPISACSGLCSTSRRPGPCELAVSPCRNESGAHCRLPPARCPASRLGPAGPFVVLPDATRPAVSRAPVRLSALTMQPLHLLLVEDNALDAELTLTQLERADYKVDVQIVYTEQGFIAALETSDFDVILADFVMPVF